MPLNSNISLDVPGVYVSEDTFGVVPSSLATFGTAYMIGYSAQAGAPTNTITYIQSVADFVNVFGSSLSLPSVQLFFDQRSGSGLYFVNVQRRNQRSLTFATPVVGTPISITVGNSGIIVNPVVGRTPATILQKFTKEINTRIPNLAYIIGNTLSSVDPLTVTASSNVTLGAVATVGAYPTAVDVAYTISTAFDPEMRQGYICAPEFFQSYNFADTRARTTVMGALEALCSDPDYNWIALIDASNDTAINTVTATFDRAIQEKNTVSSPKGHSCFFYPYWVNTLNVAVPVSASVMGVALRAYRAKGFTQPPAGVSFPVYGVVDTTIPMSNKTQAALNPAGVNAVRRLPNGRGTVIYGSRTMSQNPYYKFMTTRVIMNVLNGTLRKSFDEFIFNPIDGVGVMFTRLKLTCTTICEALRTSGALFGSTPAEAYLVICDQTNNPALDLESGKVTVDVIVKPAPVLEAMSVRLSRASIGTTLAEALTSGQAVENVSTAKDPQGGNK